MFYVQVYNPLVCRWRRSRLSDPYATIQEGLARISDLTEKARETNLKFRLVDQDGKEVHDDDHLPSCSICDGECSGHA